MDNVKYTINNYNTDICNILNSINNSLMTLSEENKKKVINDIQTIFSDYNDIKDKLKIIDSNVSNVSNNALDNEYEPNNYNVVYQKMLNECMPVVMAWWFSNNQKIL